MTMTGLDLVEKEALMMYRTQNGSKMEFMAHGKSDCEESSEYEECGEEFSDSD